MAITLSIWTWGQMVSQPLLTSYKDNPVLLLIHVLEVVFSGAWAVIHGDKCHHFCLLWNRVSFIKNGSFPYFMTVMETLNPVLSAISWHGDFKQVGDCFSCQCHPGSLLENKFGWKRKNEKERDPVIGCLEEASGFPKNVRDKKDLLNRGS